MNKDRKFLSTHPDPEVRAAYLRLAPRKAPKKPAPESVKVREAAKAERESAEAARICVAYEQVSLRAGGSCELTGFQATEGDPLEFHHVIYGRGVDRDAVTRAELMIRVKRSIHLSIHRKPLRWEAEMKEWAAGYGYTRAWNEIDRRCQRARAASRAHGGTEND